VASNILLQLLKQMKMVTNSFDIIRISVGCFVMKLYAI